MLEQFFHHGQEPTISNFIVPPTHPISLYKRNSTDTSEAISPEEFSPLVNDFIKRNPQIPFLLEEAYKKNPDRITIGMIRNFPFIFARYKDTILGTNLEKRDAIPLFIVCAEAALDICMENAQPNYFTILQSNANLFTDSEDSLLRDLEKHIDTRKDISKEYSFDEERMDPADYFALIATGGLQQHEDIIKDMQYKIPISSYEELKKRALQQSRRKLLKIGGITAATLVVGGLSATRIYEWIQQTEKAENERLTSKILHQALNRIITSNAPALSVTDTRHLYGNVFHRDQENYFWLPLETQDGLSIFISAQWSNENDETNNTQTNTGQEGSILVSWRQPNSKNVQGILLHNKKSGTNESKYLQYVMSQPDSTLSDVIKKDKLSLTTNLGQVSRGINTLPKDILEKVLTVISSTPVDTKSLYTILKRAGTDNWTSMSVDVNDPHEKVSSPTFIDPQDDFVFQQIFRTVYNG